MECLKQKKSFLDQIDANLMPNLKNLNSTKLEFVIWLNSSQISNNQLTQIKVELEVGDPADPAGVLVGDVAPVLTSVRQPNVGDLEETGGHHFHSVIKNNRLQRTIYQVRNGNFKKA